ncbi:hypothetical protein EYF80_063267 [Liparis tanakae]|uniref:Uncharacterized protein n=1 Tax=Liparis tanakae TaxID=230148 RepID=A0A4Z2ECG4_9TELE|nr:hypothetical protein EYF80_063267 [Liparis tanakae]
MVNVSGVRGGVACAGRRVTGGVCRAAGGAHLGLPLHARHGDGEQQHHRDDADDPDVIDFVHHDGGVVLRGSPGQDELTPAGLTKDPGQADEQHDPPDVQHAPHLQRASGQSGVQRNTD